MTYFIARKLRLEYYFLSNNNGYKLRRFVTSTSVTKLVIHVDLMLRMHCINLQYEHVLFLYVSCIQNVEQKTKKNGLDYSVFIVDMISSQCFAFDNI